MRNLDYPQSPPQAASRGWRAPPCEPAWDAIQRNLQDDASGEHIEHVPAGYSPERWQLVYAWQSGAVLNMYRTWVTNGKKSDIHEVANLAASLVRSGLTALQ